MSWPTSNFGALYQELVAMWTQAHMVAEPPRLLFSEKKTKTKPNWNSALSDLCNLCFWSWVCYPKSHLVAGVPLCFPSSWRYEALLKARGLLTRVWGWRKAGSQAQIKRQPKMHQLRAFFFLSLFKFWYFTTVSGFGNRRVLTFSVWCWQYWIKEIKGPVMEHTSCLWSIVQELSAKLCLCVFKVYFLTFTGNFKGIYSLLFHNPWFRADWQILKIRRDH